MKTNSGSAGPGTSRGAAAGMTLVELLIAFMIFVLLISALVAMGTQGLDTWQEGEARKDIYDRAQRLIGQMSEDLRATWSDDRWYFIEQGNLGGHRRLPAALLGDVDANQVPRLRFVRSGSRDEMVVDPDAKIKPPPYDMYYTDLWEVAYLMDSDAGKTVLHRAVRYFERPLMLTATGKRPPALLVDENVDDTSDPAFRRSDRVLDDGVLWISFRYWSQYTSTWAVGSAWTCPTLAHASAQQATGPGRCLVRAGDKVCDRELVQAKVGPLERASRSSTKLIAPELEWDSTRVLHPKLFFYKPFESYNADFVYPEIVQVTLVLETTAGEVRGTRLASDIDPSATTIRLYNARDVAEGPGFVKIGPEWVSYDRKNASDLDGVRRGQRGTKAASHASGTRVRFGDTFVADLRVPAFREAVK